MIDLLLSEHLRDRLANFAIDALARTANRLPNGARLADAIKSLKSDAAFSMRFANALASGFDDALKQSGDEELSEIIRHLKPLLKDEAFQELLMDALRMPHRWPLHGGEELLERARSANPDSTPERVEKAFRVLLRTLAEEVAVLPEFSSVYALLLQKEGNENSRRQLELLGKHLTEAKGLREDLKSIMLQLAGSPSLNTPLPASQPMLLENSTDDVEPTLGWAKVAVRGHECFVASRDLLGREDELKVVDKWITEERAKVVIIVGIGGIGKSSLANGLRDRLRECFGFASWISLQDRPQLENVVHQLLMELDSENKVSANDSLGSKMARVLEVFRNRKCLVVLDNLDSLLDEKGRAGVFLKEHRDYGRFLEYLATNTHASCLLITTREKPLEVRMLEGHGSSVHTLQLSGMSVAASVDVLEASNVTGTAEELQEVGRYFAGNPLCMKLVAEPIREVYGGDVRRFLNDRLEAGGGEVQELLEDQFRRVGELERETLFWMAIEREPCGVEDLVVNVAHRLKRHQIVESLTSLRRRNLIETRSADGRFFLQPVLLDFITAKLIQALATAVEDKTAHEFNDFAITKASSKEYVRESQQRTILEPLANLLLSRMDKSALGQRLSWILHELRESPVGRAGYGGGNVLALADALQIPAAELNFSHVAIWEAYLKGKNLRGCNFSDCNFRRSMFSETFTIVYCVAVSPDGELIAAGTAEGGIWLWEARGGSHRTVLTGHRGWVSSIQFSPDSTILLSTGGDGTIRLWSVGQERQLACCAAHKACIRQGRFSSDGKRVVTCSDDGTIAVRSSPSLESIATLKGHDGRVLTVEFLANDLLVSGGSDATVRLWLISERRCYGILKGHERSVWAVAFDSRRNVIISGGSDRTIRLWNPDTKRVTQTFSGHSGRVRSIAVSSEFIATGSEDHSVKTWSIDDGSLVQTLRGHHNWVTSVAFADASGTKIVSGGEDHVIKLWNLTAGKAALTLQGYSDAITSVSWARGSVVTASEDGCVRIWDSESRTLTKMFQAHKAQILAISTNATHELIATGGSDAELRIWDGKTNRLLATLTGHDNWVRTVCFHPKDPNILASGGFDQRVLLWNVGAGSVIREFAGHKDRVRSVSISPSLKWLAIGSGDGEVRVWDIETGQCVQSLRDHRAQVRSICFCEDSGSLVSGSHDLTLKIWDVESGQCLRTLEGSATWIWAVAASRESGLIASGEEGGMVRIYDRESGQQRYQLDHPARVRALKFLPDDVTLVSGSDDGILRFWDMTNGVCRGEVKSDRIYDGMSLRDAVGLSESTVSILRLLGAAAP